VNEVEETGYDDDVVGRIETALGQRAFGYQLGYLIRDQYGECQNMQALVSCYSGH